MKFPVFSHPLRLLLPMALAVATRGLAADLHSLLNNSPFGPTAALAPAAASGDLEFRGVVQEEGVYLVSLYNPATRLSSWVAAPGKTPGLEVKSYDASTEQVQILQAGRSLTLPLKQARIAMIAMAPAAAAPPGEAGRNPAGGNRDDPRAELHSAVRARLEKGDDPDALMRNLPPEAKAMIQEFRGVRGENGANQIQLPIRR